MKWRRVRLSEVGIWFGGGTPSKSNPDFWSNGSIPWLSPKDMGSEVITSTKDHITQAAVWGSSVKLVPSGSVAVVVRSGILERTLPVGLVPFVTTLNQDMKAVVPYEGIDARWIAWGLRAFERELLRDARKAGTTVASMEMPRFQIFELPVPPIDEQHRIVGILEDHLSRIDAAHSDLSKAEGGVAVLREAGLRSQLGSVHCSPRRLSELLTDGLSNGRSVPTQVGGFPVLRLTAIADARVDLSQRKDGAWSRSEAERFLVKEGDFLISRGNGSLGLVARGGLVSGDVDDVAFPDTVIRARPDQNRLLSEYMALVWNSRGTRSQIEAMARTTAGIYKVNQKDLGEVTLPVPALRDQARIIDWMGDLNGQVARMKSATLDAHARAQGLRRSLLAAAFSGRLTGHASDLDPAEGLAASAEVNA